MIRPLIEFLRPGDTVAEGQEGIHKVDVLEEYPLGLGGELHIGKVPEALHSQSNEPVRQRLGHALRHCQHRHVGVVLLHIVFQLLHGPDGHVVDLGTDQRRGHVEGGIHLKAHLLKVEVLQQRMAQMARSHHNEPVAGVDAQNVADFRAQLRHVIAVALLTEFTEAAEILPDLRGGDVHFLPQRIGGNAYHALVMQLVQIAVIAGQTMDHRIRDLLFFHMRPSSLPAAGAGLQPAFPYRLFSSF